MNDYKPNPRLIFINRRKLARQNVAIAIICGAALGALCFMFIR